MYWSDIAEIALMAVIVAGIYLIVVGIFLME